MYLVYFDESGDDGLPGASDLFILTSLAVRAQLFTKTFLHIKALRKQLKTKYGLPLNVELHTRALLLNKNPYVNFRFDDDCRCSIIDEIINYLPTLDIRFTNVAINKRTVKKSYYNVLDNAVDYSINRIERTFSDQNSGENYLIITDDGRIEKMRRTTRRIKQVNYVPNDSGVGYYRSEIDGLVEDPLPKKSDQSYFIQLCDLISYLVNLYLKLKIPVGKVPANLPALININQLESWFTTLTPVLNLAASRNSRFGYGIVCYPK